MFFVSLDRNFKATFDVSFSRYAGINKNDRSNYKNLTNPVNTSDVRRESKKLVSVSIENQWAEIIVEKVRFLSYSNQFLPIFQLFKHYAQGFHSQKT